MNLRPDFCLSDSHWFHKNIVKYQDRPYDHDWMMLKRWKSTVKDSHTILHLGDLFFGKKRGLDRFTNEVAPELTGKKYLILGNHDKRTIDYEALGFEVIAPYSITYQNYTVSFDHYPRLVATTEKRFHVHGHIHGNPYSAGETTRPYNINVSVEVIDYTPQRFTKLLNAAIRAVRGKEPYYNSRGYRYASAERSRRP